MNYKLGFETKLYVGTASTAPTSELTIVKDVSMDLNVGEVDASSRASGKFKVYVPGQIDASLTFTIIADSSNEQLTTIRNAWLARTPLAWKVELGDNAYFQADMYVTSMKNSQALEDVVAYDVTVRPTLVAANFPPTIATSSASNNSAS